MAPTIEIPLHDTIIGIPMVLIRINLPKWTRFGIFYQAENISRSFSINFGAEVVQNSSKDPIRKHNATHIGRRSTAPHAAGLCDTRAQFQRLLTIYTVLRSNTNAISFVYNQHKSSV